MAGKLEPDRWIDSILTGPFSIEGITWWTADGEEAEDYVRVAGIVREVELRP